MTGQDILIKLLSDGYIIEVAEDNYILSNKLMRIDPKPETVKIVKEIQDTPQATIEQFRADCQIPFRVTGVNGVKYQLNGISDYARKAFNKIMLEGEFKYSDMVAATKKYYNDSNMARVVLTNYFKQKIFESVMEEYLKNKEILPEKTNINTNGRMSL